MKTIWTRTSSFEGVAEIAQLVVEELVNLEQPFRLWLVGNLGAGKTFFSGQLLHNLGLPSHIPVPSPTYTYCNEYRIESDWYAHIDLYRAGPHITLEDLGLVDARRYRGFIVEWPDKLPAHPVLACDLALEIAFEDLDRRRYTLSGRT